MGEESLTGDGLVPGRFGLLVERLSRIVAVLALLVPGAVAAAQEPYRISEGDLLQITTVGDERLTGRFRVGADGAIGFPLVGAIAAVGATTTELASVLETRLAERVPLGGAPTVEVVDYAPVFVTGDVEKPGPQSYRPGMIALELLALGGGPKRPIDSVGGRLQRILALEQDLGDTRLQRFAALLQRARVTAETAGQEFDAKSIDDDAPIADPARRRIVAGEVSLFQVRRSVLKAEQGALASQRAGYDQEIQSLTESIRLHDEEVTLLQKEVASQENLVSRGLATSSRLLELRRQLSATRRDVLDARSYLARARQRQLEVDQRALELRNTRDRENALALKDADLAIARADQKIATILAALTDARDPVGPAAEAGLKLSILRRIDGRRERIPADDLSRLAPHDILVVMRAESNDATVMLRSTFP